MAKERRADTLPLVSELPQREMNAAIQLMQDYFMWSEQEEGIKREKAMILEKLGLLCDVLDQGGLRWGQLVTYDDGEKTRKTLNKDLMLENNIPVETIKKCYKESKPFRRISVRDLSKPRKPHEVEEDNED